MLYNKNYKWNVSGAFSHDELLFLAYDFVKKYSGENLFKSVHGSIPCKFNSGRRSVRCTQDYIKNCINEYHLRGINVFYTFSNFLLRKEDLNDTQCNQLLGLLSPEDGVIISNQLLFDYVKTNYPQLKIISSVLNAVNYFNERNYIFYNILLEKYDKIVIHPDDNINFLLLDKINDKENCEILVNERCIHNCGFRYKHDYLLCKESLDPNEENAKACIDFSKQHCVVNDECRFIRLIQANKDLRSDRLNINEIDKLYEMGFVNFKLQGRADSPASFAYDICKYLIDKKYKDLLFNMIAKNFSFCSSKSKLKIVEV